MLFFFSPSSSFFFVITSFYKLNHGTRRCKDLFVHFGLFFSVLTWENKIWQTTMAFFYSVFGIACFLVARSLGTPIFGSCSRSVCEVCGHSGQSCLLGSERVWGSLSCALEDKVRGCSPGSRYSGRRGWRAKLVRAEMLLRMLLLTWGSGLGRERWD